MTNLAYTARGIRTVERHADRTLAALRLKFLNECGYEVEVS